MRQLVELKKNANKFKDANCEIICVFREEAKGVEGLKLIKEKQKVDFTFCLDHDKKKTPRYSTGKRTFDNYVIDKDGVVRAVIKGSLTKRANSERLLKELANLNR